MGCRETRQTSVIITGITSFIGALPADVREPTSQLASWRQCWRLLPGTYGPRLRSSAVDVDHVFIICVVNISFVLARILARLNFCIRWADCFIILLNEQKWQLCMFIW